MKKLLTLVLLLVTASSLQAKDRPDYKRQAETVTDHIQKTFFDSDSGVYFKTTKRDKLDWVWLQSVMFANLAAAARIEPEKYAQPMDAYFKALDGYWDDKVQIPGYEPGLTKGNGNDKYYDDNAWLAIAFVEAYETNRDARYLKRADETQRFVLSGWDDEIGGGIWWHERHKDGTKNTCANGPAAVGCLVLAKHEPEKAAALIQKARDIVAWTNSALQDSDGLFDDRKVVKTGEIKRGKLTYNSALMLRANLGLYRATGEQAYLDEAIRIGKAADWFLDSQTGVYRDALRYCHFMIEADLELYEETGDTHYLKRAQHNVDALYARWEAEKPDDMMSSACLARVLWLMSEVEVK
ncbi:glycoside hydrolase family 76 protein [Blastopirellula sp. JC732]|uniref:Glycoside hydrolase family 76 protein n=1 Tax=Blastopirellula sediminis TaxID=2894196 RepID=A0A9X1SDM8_9BACT|nr:glycoside hydrolase family 76 protein [Blastopirellula sediminis]MCC9604295.1 glycoside hydrolase family 76 protein [Blastopirellula sediminis]MCC9626815.1 glycoside hydrolase family 76 protein [Blastopirellula sediminis]